MTSTNKILIGILVTQGAITAAVYATQTQPKLGKPKAIIDGLQAADVTSVQITKGGVDVTPEAVTLEKRDEKWVVASHFDYPGDASSITSFVGKLAGMRSPGPVTNSPSRHRQLEVSAKQFQRKIEIKRQGQEKADVLFLGNSPSHRRVYVRPEQTDSVYEVSSLTSWDADSSPSRWIEREYFQVEKSQVVAMRISNDNGTFELKKGTDGAWLVTQGASSRSGQELDTTKIDNLVQAAARINIDVPAGKDPQPDFGLDRPKATVTVTVQPPPPPKPTNESEDPLPPTEADGDAAQADAGVPETAEQAVASAPAPQQHTVRIGKEEDGRFYVHADAKPFVAKVSKWSMEKLVNLKTDDLYVVDDNNN